MQGLTLADPKFYEPKNIDILIGADLFMQLVNGEVVRGRPGSPSAISTKLGYLLSGIIRNNRLILLVVIRQMKP